MDHLQWKRKQQQQQQQKACLLQSSHYETTFKINFQRCKTVRPRAQGEKKYIYFDVKCWASKNFVVKIIIKSKKKSQQISVWGMYDKK